MTGLTVKAASCKAITEAVAFGMPLIANPDLSQGFELNTNLNKPDSSFFMLAIQLFILTTQAWVNKLFKRNYKRLC